MRPSFHKSNPASIREYLICWEGFHAAVNLLLTAVLVVVSLRVHSRLIRDLLALVAAVVAYRPIIYFLFPPLMMLVLVLIVRFSPRHHKPDYPCPVCGYDVRATLSRCPECGTELQWGQLPDKPDAG